MSASRQDNAREPLGSSLLGLSQRQPPHNLQAEQALLGAILANAKAYFLVADFLRAHHFADPVHAAIYEAAGARISKGGVADAITMRRHFEGSALLDEYGGAGYLAELLSSMVGIINAAEYGRAIVDDWTRRELIDVGETLVNRAFDRTAPVEDTLTEAVKGIDVAAAATTERAPTISMDRALDAALEAVERAAQAGGPVGTLTGFPSLDRVYNGLKPQTFHVLAGRPGMGKSALGWQIAINVGLGCRDGRMPGGVFFQSLEMAADELGERALSAFGNVPAELLQRGEHQLHRSGLIYARDHLAGLPLEIDETPSLNIQQIAVRAREVHRKFKGLSLIVVDHLHIVAHDPDAGRRQMGMVQTLGEITKGLKKLAKDLRCPVLALAQLSRGVESREDKRPVLTDLRASGDIEQDADSVAFVYRPEYYLGKGDPEQRAGERLDAWQARVREYDEQKARVSGKAEIIFEKMRRGQGKIVKLRWDGDTTSFSEPSGIWID